MREESMRASLWRWRIEDELGLAVLLLHGVGMADHHGAIWITVRGNPQAE